MAILLIVVMVFALTACGGSSGGNEAKDKYEKYPEQPISMIIGFSAGGGCDNVHRMSQPYFEKALGGTLAIDNKPGANGGLACSEVAEADPDGYTMVGVTVGPASITPIMTDLGYTDEDLIPCVQLAELVVGWCCKSDKWSSVDEVIEYAKAHPGEVRIGTSGVGSIHHVTVLKIEKALGIEGLFTHVPYNGTADVVTAVLGGDVEMGMGEASAFSSHADAGELNILATMGNERSDFFPDIPTMKECGFDVESTIWVGNAFPAGTPIEIVKKVSDAYGEAAKNQEMLDAFAEAKIPFVYMDYEAFAEKWHREYAENQELLKPFIEQ